MPRSLLSESPSRPVTLEQTFQAKLDQKTSFTRSNIPLSLNHTTGMPIRAIPKVSIARNGVGIFVLPCKRIELQYCNWGGSSQGMRDFISNRLSKFASSHPQIEFNVIKKRGHPVVKGHYSENNNIKPICVRNLNVDNVENALKKVINSSGRKLKNPKQNVESLNESVRGIWSPFHVHKDHRHNV